MQPGIFFWFKAKEKLIEMLLGKLSSKTKLTILNIGAGDDLSVIRQFGEVYAVDADQEALTLIPDDSVVEKKYATCVQYRLKTAFLMRL